MNREWLQNFKGPLLITFYQDLKENLKFELKRICDFLDVEIREANMECAMSRKDGIFRRPRQDLTFDPFDKSMKLFLNERKSNLHNVMWDRDHLNLKIPPSTLSVKGFKIYFEKPQK